MNRFVKYEDSFIFILVFTFYCGITCIESSAQTLRVKLKIITYVYIHVATFRSLQDSFLMSEIFVNLSILVLYLSNSNGSFLPY